MGAPSSQSTRSSLGFAIALLVAFVFVWEYFDLEQKLLGYPWFSYMWNKFVAGVQSIPAMLDSMLRSLNK